ncbi:MAG: TylF/MycF/NovP-related O-methyltransferase [Alphaproteobacteria bacterium]
MNFYGPRDYVDQRLMHERFLELQEFLYKLKVPCFFNDNLAAIYRIMSFLYDEKFMTAFSAAKGEGDKQDEAKLWRLHTLAWCGHAALNVPGDFVECGVYKGLYSAMLTNYLDWGGIDRRFYLYDTFAGLPEDWSSEYERESVNIDYDWDGTYDAVRQRFARFPNVEVVKGVVPDIFAERSPAKIAMLHLDLNAARAEIAALDVLAGRLSNGAIVLMDDYGRLEQLALAEALTSWWREHDHHILELPTGQGMVTVNAAKLQAKMI